MVKNLGQVSAIKKDSVPPTNTQLMWFNTTNGKFYVYDIITSSWKLNAADVSEVYRSDVASVVAGSNRVDFTSDLSSSDYALQIFDISGVGVEETGRDESGFDVLSLGDGDIVYLAIKKQ